jgi:hypothetical protein
MKQKPSVSGGELHLVVFLQVKTGSNAVIESRVKVSVGHKKEEESETAINQRGKRFIQELGR